MRLKRLIIITFLLLPNFILLNCTENKVKSNSESSDRIEALRIVKSVMMDFRYLDSLNAKQLIKKLDSAIWYDETYSYSSYYKALIYSFLNDTLLAFENINKTVFLDSNDYNFWQVKGIIFDKFNEKDTATLCYNKSLKILDSLLKINEYSVPKIFDRLLTLCLLDKKNLALVELSKIKDKTFYKVQYNDEQYKEIINFNKSEYLKQY